MPKIIPGGGWAPYAKELGLSMQRVAYDSGMSRYTYQKFEKGESMPGTPANPSLRNVMAIAQVLGVTLDELLPPSWPDLHAR